METKFKTWFYSLNPTEKGFVLETLSFISSLLTFAIIFLVYHYI
jgi:hypothetical protein